MVVREHQGPQSLAAGFAALCGRIRYPNAERRTLPSQPVEATQGASIEREGIQIDRYPLHQSLCVKRNVSHECILADCTWMYEYRILYQSRYHISQITNRRTFNRTAHNKRTFPYTSAESPKCRFVMRVARAAARTHLSHLNRSCSSFACSWPTIQRHNRALRTREDCPLNTLKEDLSRGIAGKLSPRKPTWSVQWNINPAHYLEI